jgi:hypothetical protein
MAEVIVDTEELKRIALELKGFPDVAPKAMSSALNRTITTVKTDMKREVVAAYEVKGSDVTKSLSVKKSSPNKLSAEAISQGRPIALAHFKFKPKKPMAGKTRRKVMVKVKKSEGFTEIKSKPAAFVQNPNGATNIFKREGQSRLPIKRLYSLSVPQMLGNQEVINRITVKAHETLEKRVKHEIEYRLKKIKGSE